MKKISNRVLRNIFCICLCILTFVSLIPMSAKADLIVEPENRFYFRHKKDCEFWNRTCIAREETVKWKSPNSSLEKGILKKEAEVYITVVYTDEKGLKWGLVENGDDWVLMADMDLIYESDEFLADHWNEITEAAQPKTFPEGTKMIVWTYPESGAIRDADWTTPKDLDITTIYTDAEGREWGYVSYFLGNRELWFCLSDLENETIPGTQKQQLVPAQVVDEALRTEALQHKPLNVWMLVIPVLLVVSISGILLLCLSKKKR